MTAKDEDLEETVLSRLEQGLSLKGIRLCEMSPLMYYLFVLYDLETATKIIRKGVDIEINFQNDSNGFTVLHMACEAGSTEYVELLLSASPPPNLELTTIDHEFYFRFFPGGKTPIFLTLTSPKTNSKMECIKLLLQAGAEYENQDLCGNTPFLHGCLERNTAAVDIFTKYLHDQQIMSTWKKANLRNKKEMTLEHEDSEVKESKTKIETKQTSKEIEVDGDKIKKKKRKKKKKRATTTPPSSINSDLSVSSTPQERKIPELSALTLKSQTDTKEVRERLRIKWGFESQKIKQELSDFTQLKRKELKLKEVDMKSPIHIILAPCAGIEFTHRSAWYHWLALNLVSNYGIYFHLENFPEPLRCREKAWVPYLRNKILEINQHNQNARIIVIGHSTGADAVLRVLEDTKILGGIIVSSGQKPEEPDEAELTPEERDDIGWYNRPWLYEQIKKNSSWLIHYHSKEDEIIPISEAHRIHKHLNTEYREMEARGHFDDKTFPEIITDLVKKLGWAEK